VKRNIFPLAVLAAVLLVTACPQPDDFISDSNDLTSGNFFDNDTYARDEGFPETSAEVTVWIINDEGARQEYENLQSALDWLKDNAANGVNYTVRLGKDQTIAPQNLNYGASGASIIINGVRGEKQISPSKTGSLFTIGANVTLTLGRGITLKGRSDNKAPLVSVEKNGTLVMKDGSVIRDNVNTDGYYTDGAGVNVAGKFIMDGGSILNNRSDRMLTNGGGVLLTDSADFTMNGGLISGNYAGSNGGGVGSDHSLISNERAVFLMTGGIISNNASGSGGGAYVSSYTSFTMTGGTISNNKAYSGGGVDIHGYAYGGSGEFIMTGGVISNNLAELTGGGIFSQYAHKGKVVIGGNAVISGNEANITNPFHGNSCGGGIYTSSIVLEGNCVIEGNKARKGAGVYLTYHESVKTVTFTMTGGVIRSNTAIEYGGGVALCYLSQGQLRDYAVPFAFDKTGGTIYGYDGSASANVVLNAVNKDIRPSRPNEDDQGEDNNNQGGISIVPYGNDQGGNNNNQGNQGNGNNNNQGNQGNGGNNNNQGGNGNNQGNGGNNNNQGEDDDDQGGGGNNGGGALADKGHAVFVFDLYWGKSYSGSDDVSTFFVRKETTSFPANSLAAFGNGENKQSAGAWD